MKRPVELTARLYIAIGIGGMFGAVSRYAISILLTTDTGFPFPTLIVNLIGCFLLSYLLNHKLLKRKLAPEIHTAIGTGVIGAFTTFSTFATETVQLWGANATLAVSYVLISIIGGVAFCYAGFRIAIGRQAEQ